MVIPLSSKEAAKPKERESDIQRAILDWLAAERIWHIRLNTGAMFGTHKGKKWAVRFGKPGLADILAVPLRIPLCPQTAGDGCLEPGNSDWLCEACSVPLLPIPQPIWIEVKTPHTEQTEDQSRFQDEVNEAGMDYIVARNLDDVIAALRG